MTNGVLKKEELFKFLKIFIFLFLIILILINLETVKGIFNYKNIYSRIFGSRNQAEQIMEIGDATDVNFEIQETEISAEELEIIGKENSIEISKIEVSAPLVFIDTQLQEDYSKGLDRGVVHYTDSVLPGENGMTIFLGHSAPSGWIDLKHDSVFSRLNELVFGDEIVVYFNNRQYRYSVEEKLFLDKGEELPEYEISESKNVLILLTCWPPGVDRYRIMIKAPAIDKSIN
jgi:LPXTG-site transpeptidase (sortase) family protein